jgi:hypothetical protein
LPEAGLPIDGDLYGNGAPMVPNVHAVMAWVARKTRVVNEIEVVRSHESLKKRGTGGIVPTPKSNRLRG